MQLLDGRLVSKARLDQLCSEIQDLARTAPRKAALHVIRVGEDPASKVYVGKKIQTCLELGIESKEHHLSDNISEEDLLKIIDQLNADDSVDGILVQLPLPQHLDVNRVLYRVDPNKDVDGFHPVNLGRLVAMEDGFVPCTPKGIIALLEHYKVPIEGKRAVVIGRSRIVGRPMSLLLDQAGATVTVVHKATPNPSEINRTADILVVAAGVKHLVGAKDVKEGAVVVDVGIHRKDDGKLTGDVDFEAVKDKCAWISPVPGGVGPMTITGLLENTLKSFKKRIRP